MKHIIEEEELGRVFAIEYDKNFKLMHVISGSDVFGKTIPLGYTFDVAEGNMFGQLLETWEPDDSVSLKSPCSAPSKVLIPNIFFSRAFPIHTTLWSRPTVSTYTQPS